MANPKIQIIVEPQLLRLLRREAIRRGKTLSAYCGEVLATTHHAPWISVNGPERMVKAIRRLITGLLQ
jgi:hypothetical protein